jgi:hypothetical protein
MKNKVKNEGFLTFSNKIFINVKELINMGVRFLLLKISKIKVWISSFDLIENV